MFIEFNERFAQFDESAWLPYAQAVENLILAFAEGWHVVVMPRQAAATLADHDMLSLRQRQIVRFEILAKASTLYGEISSATLRICIVPDDVPESKNDANIYLHLSRFALAEASHRARLLVEDNQSDKAFIELLLDAYASNERFNRPRQLEYLNGGGGSTAKQFKDAFSEIRPLVCVVDSDRDHAEGVLGSTARAVAAVGECSGSGMVRSLVWPAREIENLIPISFLFEVYKSDPEVKSVLSRYHSFKKAHRDDCASAILLYCDMKSGANFGKIYKFPEAISENYCKFVAHFHDGDVKNRNVAHQAYLGISLNVIPRTLRSIKDKPWLVASFKQELASAPYWGVLADKLAVLAAFAAGGRRLPI